MGIKLYKECKIVPFDYNKEKYIDIINSDTIGEFFTAVKFESQVLNEQGKKLLTEAGKDENEMVMKKFVLSDKGRKTYNFSLHKNYQYVITYSKYKFLVQMDNIELWLLKNGKGFLTIQIKSTQENMSKDMIFQLHALHWFSDSTKLNWEKPISKGHKEHRALSLKTLTGDCLDSCSDLNIQKRGMEYYDLSLVMTDAMGDIYNKDDSTKYCMKMQLHRTDISDELKDVKVCDYIHWTLSERAVLSWVDESMVGESTSGEKNRRFLKNFPESVFTNYLAIYLYYLSRYLECKDIEQMLDQNDLNHQDVWALQKPETKFPVLTEENYKRIDKIFREALCKKQWNLQERLKEVSEKVELLNQFQTDVFISYRHDGGQYLALLLYERLEAMGFTVFWDRRSLRAGTYKEQLYESIEECKAVIAIISPGSMQRLNEKDDWVRKELAYAFSHEKNVLLVGMENIKFPEYKDREQYPEDIRKITECTGKEAKVEYFDDAIERIAEALQ